MADKTQLAMLKSGVSVWSLWRAAHADLRPELADAHLYGIDFIGANLVGSRFLSRPQLVAACSRQAAYRDPDLACGAAIPSSRGRF
jgi:hypothetical protein